MKFILLLFLFSLSTFANPSWDQSVTAKYTSESPLPAGWKIPSNYFQIIVKNQPSYRMAITDGSRSLLTFPRLFRHIKKQDISMTAPVMIYLSDEESSIKKEKMAFLYKDKSISTASENKKVYVQDVPTEKVLSYTWQGCDCEKNQKAAKGYLIQHAKTAGFNLSDFRLLGYNSPSLEDDKQTWEMQAVIK